VQNEAAIELHGAVTTSEIALLVADMAVQMAVELLLM
jgi:hypothetical protein